MDERKFEHRRGSLRALAAELPRIAGAALGKHGFAEAQLVAQWSSIMGADLAEKTLPVKLAFPRGERRDGTLRLHVAAGYALELQHREPQLLERINGFFGYRAVARLVFVQAPLAAPAAGAKPPRPLAPEERTALDQRLASVQDPELRAALERLGAAVIGSTEE